MKPRRLIGIFMIALASGASAEAATTLQVSITAIAGRSVFVDHGRTDGVAPGMRVKFIQNGDTPAEGVVADVSSSSARVELIGVLVPRVGSRGEIQVPDPVPGAISPSTRPSIATRPTTIPSHPPWEREEQARTPDMPLLSPAFATPPSKRASTFHGRVFQQQDASVDFGGGRSDRYWLARTGTSFVVTNPFGQGGEFRFDGEYDFRDQTDDDTRNDVIIKRLSYALGTEDASPYRIELGRFTSYYLPEIGWVDGVEAAARFDSGLSIGDGVGGYPRPFVDQDIGQDLGFHVFADYSSKGSGRLNATLGYQHTWRDGTSDRDLFIARASTWLTPKLWLYGSASTDVYNSSDAEKSRGPQSTTAWIQARYMPDPSQGAALSYSHFTWADIRGRDYPPVPLEVIRDGRVERVELSAWHDIVPHLRPTLRLNLFDDERTSGLGGEADLDWSQIGGTPVSWHNALFYASGDYTDEYGLRSQWTATHGDFDAYAGYELIRSISPDTQTDSGTLYRHNLRAGIGWQHGNWYYSVNADYYFGDSENAYRVGTFIEYRF